MQIINPINHGNSESSVKQYKVEPYVIAADVYALKNNMGRGGWTWYTGSAGWMYQLLIGSFIGLERKGDKLYFKPCIPENWNAVKVNYRYMDTEYSIELIKAQTADQKSEPIQLVNDGGKHTVKLFW